MLADESVRTLVRRRAPAAELQAAALAGGMRTLRQDGIEKMLQGLTDLPEVIAEWQGVLWSEVEGERGAQPTWEERAWT
jgi:type II secretory ATPase GspE/PulE/Tfp pilus assembly ATPase PilB-like protein